MPLALSLQISNILLVTFYLFKFTRKVISPTLFLRDDRDARVSDGLV